MKINNIDVNDTLKKAKDILGNDKSLPTPTKAIFESLIMVTDALINRLSLNSSNSSNPPSSDQRKKKKKPKPSNRRRGGQHGHEGTTLKPVSDPDDIQDLAIDRHTLPRGKKYQSNGYVSRQVVNLKISRIITEYRAEILIDDEGNEYVADFPEGVTRPIQYGASVKAHATYASNYQLIPYERIQEQFRDSYHIPMSTGSIYNFNVEVSNKLRELGFDKWVKKQLAEADVNHADETSINLDGKKIWLHNVSNKKWTWFEPHTKRGSEAMDAIGIIPLFSGVLCHDHWKPYYKYEGCVHSLCNAHHLRELTYAHEQDNQKWAEKMRLFLLDLNNEVDHTQKGALSRKKIKKRREQYRRILAKADKACPAVKPDPGKKRKPKQTKSRNLLDRLRDYEDDVLRFMVDPVVPFTNNQGERDIRMVKVQQKISGCFRSIEGAINFCITRSYLSTCKKNGVSGIDALEMILKGKLPDFIQEKLDSS